MASMRPSPDQLIGAPGDDQVNVVIQLQQVIHLVPTGHQTDRVSAAKLAQSLSEEKNAELKLIIIL